MNATRASFLSALRALSIGVALLVLAGCAGTPPVPASDARFALPRQLHVVQMTAGQPAMDMLLVVQREGAALRWSLFDPMGVPQARQMLERGHWRNDGFLRPNTRARDLFAALMFAWTPQADLNSVYGAGAWSASSPVDGAAQRVLLKDGRARWTIRWPDSAQREVFSIHAANDVIWRITPLKEQP